jgi:hypothetical protein
MIELPRMPPGMEAADPAELKAWLLRYGLAVAEAVAMRVDRDFPGDSRPDKREVIRTILRAASEFAGDYGDG